jgi:hypothetical protein
MFVLRNIPIVIEPGVGAIEAEFVRVNPNKENAERIIAAQLHRLALDENVLRELPFLPDTKYPHVFSTTADFKQLSTLVVYDFLGRLSVFYVRNLTGRKPGAWEKQHVAEEYAGRTITQFSVRFCFNSAKSRDAFLAALEHLVEAQLHNRTPSPKALKDALRLLGRSRIAPVPAPVAAVKDKMSIT